MVSLAAEALTALRLVYFWLTLVGKPQHKQCQLVFIRDYTIAAAYLPP